MSKWIEGKLKDLVEVNPTVKLIKGEIYPFVSMDVIQSSYKPVEAKEEREFKSGGAKFENGDTLFARITPCLENGKIAQVKNLKNGKGFGSTEFIVLRGKEGITDTDFVYYLVTNKAFRENAERLMVGTSGRQRVDKQQFEDQIISIPDLETQKRISSILGSIDRKIELNVEMNKTLEEMAMTLYKHWFVDFGPFQDGEFRESELGMIPKGWKVIRLEEIITLKHGYAFKSKQFSDEENEKVVVRMGNFKEGPGLQFLDNTKFLIDDSVDEKYKLKPNDLVIVLSDVTREGRIIGRAGFIPEDHREYWLNQRVAKIETEKMYKYLLYCLFNSDLFRHHCITSANSTTVLNLKNEHLYNYKIALPDDKVIFEFNKKMETIIRLILENEQQNISLMHTRDYLLPRLLSGEIDVSQAEKQVEEVL